jgi:molybdopterin-guanine dinucleotide biosynthesis protein A
MSSRGVPGIFSLVLAGGASSRMGADKALLSYGNGPQVKRVAGMLEQLCPPVSISVRHDQLGKPVFAGMRLLPDREEGVGPLEGILSAFREAPDHAWLVVAVDMPYLSEATIRHLLESRDASVFATAYRNPQTDRPEPVCAIYEPRILPVLEAAKAEKRYSLMLLRDVPIRLVEPVRARELRNINDPDEFRQAGGVSSPLVP